MFRENRQKLCGNYDFLQNFHTMKLDEITVFYAVYNLPIILWITINSKLNVKNKEI